MASRSLQASNGFPISSKIGKPFDASHEHHGDEPLTLLNIVRTRLPATGAAFLSACHMAELTDKRLC